jgi:hypothetical protein
VRAGERERICLVVACIVFIYMKYLFVLYNKLAYFQRVQLI